MDAKISQYSPKMSKMSNITQNEQNPGEWDILLSIFIYKFWNVFVICSSPQNGGIAKDSKVMHNWWTKFGFESLRQVQTVPVSCLLCKWQLHIPHSVWAYTNVPLNTFQPSPKAMLLCDRICISYILSEPTKTTFHYSHSSLIPWLCCAMGLA